MDPGRATVVVLGLAAALLAHAQPAVEEIVWLAGDAPIVNLPSGKVRTSDRVIDWLSPRLPDIRHRRMIANAKRTWLMIGEGQRVCNVGSLHTPEREQLAYFSDIGMLPPLQLVVRRDQRDKLALDERGEVDLAALLADSRWRGALVAGRSYGSVIDALVARRSPGANLQMVSTPDHGRQMLDMVRKQRADYTLEFAQDVWTLTRSHADADLLVAVPIRGASDWLVGGVACPRTPWGQAAIRRIDHELGTPEGAAMLRETLLAQFPPEIARAHGEAIDAFFKRRSQPTPGL